MQKKNMENKCSEVFKIPPQTIETKADKEQGNKNQIGDYEGTEREITRSEMRGIEERTNPESTHSELTKYIREAETAAKPKQRNEETQEREPGNGSTKSKG